MIALIGQAPNHRRPDVPALAPAGANTGARIAAMLGVSHDEYLRAFPLRANWTDICAWSLATRGTLRDAARAYLELDGATGAVVLGGGIGRLFLGMDLWERAFTPSNGTLVPVTIIPHPSGRNRMYNDKLAVRRATRVLRAAMDLNLKELDMKAKKTRTKKPPKLIGLPSDPQGMTFDDYDPKIEQPLLRAILGGTTKVTDLGLLCFYDAGAAPNLRGKRAGNKVRAKSWARNALRRPLREGHLDRVAPGDYDLTAAGRRMLRAAAATGRFGK